MTTPVVMPWPPGAGTVYRETRVPPVQFCNAIIVAADDRASSHRDAPSRAKPSCVEPCADVLVLSRDVETELLGRIVEIAGQRYVGDGRRDA